MRPRLTSQLVLAALAVVWVAGVIRSLHHHALPWFPLLFVDVAWLQALLVALGAFGTVLVLVGVFVPALTPPPLTARRPFVTILVSAKNEETVIARTVRNLAALEYSEDGGRQFELIVIDDQSTDRTPQILAKLAREEPISVVHTPAGSIGKAAALNLGMAHARGELVAVLDADARVRADFLTRMTAHISRPSVGGVQCQRRLYNGGQNVWTRLQDDEYRLVHHPMQRARQALGGMVSFSGNGLLLRRDALDDVGGWNEEALTEDIDLTVRFHLAGWDIQYCEDVVVWEEAVPTLTDLIRQRARWFEGALRCLGDHLPAMVFSPMRLFVRIDMVVFLSGGLLFTLGLLTSYFYAVVHVAGADLLVVQLPRSLAVWSSGFLTAGLLAAVLTQTRGRVADAGAIVVRSVIFSLHRLIVVPLAIFHYLRSAVTGRTTWEKTAHGAAIPPGDGDL
ncbi:MAG TPA: glycosyltransferase family 2 protein [bacterium]|nr:glycosyltransferase family 2 protein [bacterium]